MKKSIYILGLLLMTLTACESWFDVQPAEELSSDDLYSTGSGYRLQLNGIYMTLSKPALYGQELSWGFMDVLGQYYSKEKMPQGYQDVNDLNYGVSAVKNMIEGIWNNMYHAVADANNLIEYVSVADSSLFEFGERERKLIHGEALALRAFIHLDLLRMFAPAPVANENGKWIPYVTSSESVINSPITVKETMTHILDDLREARGLVAVSDSIEFAENNNFWNFQTSFSYDYPIFMQARRMRMNLHAIMAIQARAYMYNGQKKEAHDCAKDVLGEEPNEWGGPSWDHPYGFTDEWELMGDMYNRDTKLRSDVILGFANSKCADLYEIYLTLDRNLALRNLNGVFQDKLMTNDFRYVYLINDIEGGAEVSIKNLRGKEHSGGSQVAAFLLPVIRHTELSYIIGEYLSEVPGQLDKAIEVLRMVQQARGEYRETSITTKEEYLSILLNEARREFIGEGQSFYMYKRLGIPLNDGLSNIDYGGKVYFPIPDSEVVLL